mgnify:CR=1 FL=1
MTGFGQTGPYRERPGYDFMIQGMGGMMSVTGEPDGAAGRRAAARRACRSPTSSPACTPRSRSAPRWRIASATGRGQHLDLALLDSQIALLAYQNTNYFATGEPPKRIGNLHPNIVPYQPFRTRDGDVILACGNDNLFRKFCEAAGCTELAERSALRHQRQARGEPRRADATAAGDLRKKHDRASGSTLLEAAGVPNGPINDIAQVFAGAAGQGARRARSSSTTPAAGKLPLVASPMRFSDTPVEYRLGAAGARPAHRRRCCAACGKSDAEIARLRSAGVIDQP